MTPEHTETPSTTSNSELSTLTGSLRELWPSDDELSRLKMEINNLLWMHGPESLTLKQAEVLSCSILHIVLHGEAENNEN